MSVKNVQITTALAEEVAPCLPLYTEKKIILTVYRFYFFY